MQYQPTLFKYKTSDKDRICRICRDKIVKHTWAIVLENVHVPPKYVDLHFHEGCFFRSLDDASECSHPLKGVGF